MCRSNCLQSLIWKVVTIRFFHRKQCLIVTSFDIVPSASLHLNHFFFVFFVFVCISISKRWFCTNHKLFFLIRAIFSLICWRVFLGDSHIHLTSIISYQSIISYHLTSIILYQSIISYHLTSIILYQSIISYHITSIYHIKANSVSNILRFPERQLYCPYVVKNAFVLDILNG